MRVRGLVVLAAASLLLVGTACELLVSHDLTVEPQETDAAPADAATTEASAGDALCPYSVEPDLSANGDDGDSGNGNTAVLVFRTVSVGPPSGVDLDRVCTCQFNGALNGCDLPAGAPKGGACDADGGIDDRAAELFSQFPGGLAQQFTNQANRFTACGRQTVLLGLSDYNGLANDSQVEVNAVASVGILDVPVGGADGGVDPGDCNVAAPDSGTPHFLPRWDGKDSWAVAPNGMFGGFPSTVPIHGVVRNWELVADSRANGQEPNVVIVVNSFGTGNVRLTSPVVTGRIRPTFADGGVLAVDDSGVPIAPPGSFVIEGSISGRASADDIVKTAAHAPLDTSGTPACTMALFDTFKPQICGYRDMSFDPSLDFVKGHTCDAVSTTLQFVAYPARIGMEHPVADAGAEPCRPDQIICSDDRADAGGK